MRENYIAIITNHLSKLTEEQLFKVLVLVKEAAEAGAPVALPRNIPLTPKSKPLADSLLLQACKSATEDVKKMLFELGMTDGYGIFSVTALSSDDKNRVSSYVCFCKKNDYDAVVEVAEVVKDAVTYTLMVRKVGWNEVRTDTYHTVNGLKTAVKNINTNE